MMPVTAKEFAATIRPAVNGQSDKFSWRMYKRALKNGRERVYISTYNRITGETIKPSLDALKAGESIHRSQLMIGHAIDDGWFHGSRLMAVTNAGRTLMDFAFGPNFDTANWLDVTDWFWREYLARGRCIIHGDLVHEWVRINASARKCAHCGKHERRTVRTVHKVERVESWATDERIAPGQA